MPWSCCHSRTQCAIELHSSLYMASTSRLLMQCFVRSLALMARAGNQVVGPLLKWSVWANSLRSGRRKCPCLCRWVVREMCCSWDGRMSWGSEPWSSQTNDLKIDTCHFLARYWALSWYRQDWLAQCMIMSHWGSTVKMPCMRTVTRLCPSRYKTNYPLPM